MGSDAAKKWEMLLRLLNLIFLGVVGTILIVPAAQAQNADLAPPSEQNEALRDSLMRMRIQREVNEHKKLLEKATRIRDLVELLKKDVSSSPLKRNQDEKLREIEKLARNIRSDSGSSNDDQPLETFPVTLDAALRQLGTISQQLNTSLAKTSRHVVSVAVIAEASEIIQLIKIIRNYLD